MKELTFEQIKQVTGGAETSAWTGVSIAATALAGATAVVFAPLAFAAVGGLFVMTAAYAGAMAGYSSSSGGGKKSITEDSNYFMSIM